MTIKDKEWLPRVVVPNTAVDTLVIYFYEGSEENEPVEYSYHSILA